MGVFCSEKPAPGIQSGSLVRSIFLQRFPGPTRRWLTFAVAALLLPLTLPGQSTAHLSATPADYGKLPLSFEANQGQSDPQVKFLAHGQGYGLFLTDRAAVLTLNKVESAPSKQDDGRGRRASRTNAGAVKTDVVRMELAGASPDLQVTGSGQLPGKANYFIGSDPAKWHAAIPTYAKVKYADVYPGVDLVYYGNQRQLEYDFVVAAGADPKPVRLHFAGAAKLKLKADGDLEVIGRNGEVVFHKPEIYQMKDGQRRPVEGSFKLMARNNVGFALGSYDHARELVIDPVLVYSTFLGGNSGGNYMDQGYCIAVDNAGNAYAAGIAYSDNFPVTTNGFQRVNKVYSGLSTGFVTKFNATGSALVYSTYLGGHGVVNDNFSVAGDTPFGIAVDGAGNAYVTGQAYSTDFPVTSGAYQTVNNGQANYASNAFVTKLDATGSNLSYSTYLGGSGFINLLYPLMPGDTGYGIAVDSEGNAYIAGQAYSTNFPSTQGAFQTVNNAAAVQTSNAFITKLNPAGSGLIYSTFLGGSGYNPEYHLPYGDGATAIALDGEGNVYVTGGAYSSDFPLRNPYQEENLAVGSVVTGDGGSNAFVTKLNSTGSDLVYSTYLGGPKSDSTSGIAVAPSGNAYVTGTTGSGFPVTTNAFQQAPSADFVTEFDAAGSSVVYSSYLGGSQGRPEEIFGVTGPSIAVDAAGNAYVAGWTADTDFPVTSDAYQKRNYASWQTWSGNGFGNEFFTNAFFAKINPEGSALLYSTYFAAQAAFGIVLDSADNVYLTGAAFGGNLPTTWDAFQVQAGGAFVAKFAFNPSLTPTQAVISSSVNPARVTQKITYTAVTTSPTDGNIPTGSVGFSVDDSSPSYVTLNDTGHASYTTSIPVGGNHIVAASYRGDANYAASTGSLMQTVSGTPSYITIASGAGQTTTYGSWFASPVVAVVTDANGLPVPDVEVNFSGTGLLFFHQIAATNADGTVAVNVKASATGSNLVGNVTVNGGPSVSFNESAVNAQLNVTPKNVTVPHGEAIPALTYSITGFVNGDAPSVVTGAPTESTSAVKGSPIGTYPILLSQGTLAAPNYSFDLLQGTLTVTTDGAAAKPYFSPPGNTYAPGQMVMMTDSTPGAVIHYTTDGSTPTAASPIYMGPITLNADEVISALAVAPGYTNSQTQIERYWIK
jgi:Chitobiase/beta-hexosaminidase C-terminal domain/MBG domain (YGX type)/Bacterial Ig-like domain (group 3)/Beta-propeller repeat